MKNPFKLGLTKTLEGFFFFQKKNNFVESKQDMDTLKITNQQKKSYSLNRASVYNLRLPEGALNQSCAYRMLVSSLVLVVVFFLFFSYQVGSVSDKESVPMTSEDILDIPTLKNLQDRIAKVGIVIVCSWHRLHLPICDSSSDWFIGLSASVVMSQ